MRVVVLQGAAGLDKAANLVLLTKLFEQAALYHPDLVVAPEAIMHDFGAGETELGPAAEPLDGPFVSALSEQAKAVGAVIVAGMFESSTDAARPYNTLVALGSDGDLVASYRKAHLYDSFGYRESERLLAGDPRPVVVEAEEFTVGLMTCYDLRFPEFARLLVDAGATVLAVPAAWVRGPLKEDHWETLMRARAIENTCFMLGAAQCGTHYVGRSMIVDPMGVALASLGEAPGVAVADLDPGRLEEVRRANPSLRNRRLG